MEPREETLRREIRERQQELWKIEAAQKQKVAGPYVGKFFKYQNRYSSGPSWWLYIAVVSASDGNLTAWTFQEDCNGEARIDREYTRFAPLDSSHIEISAVEWMAEWARLSSRWDAEARAAAKL